MNAQSERPRVVQVRKTRAGWNIQLDAASWTDLLAGLAIAADVTSRGTAKEQERATRLRALRSALTREQE